MLETGIEKEIVGKVEKDERFLHLYAFLDIRQSEGP